MSNSEFNKTFRRMQNAKRRIKSIMDNPKDNDELTTAEFANDDIDSLIDSIFAYTKAVFLMNKNEKNRTSIFANNDRQNAIEIIEAGERARKSAHNELISCIKIADISCELLGVEPIYGELLDKLDKMYENYRGFPKGDPRHMENNKDTSILTRESNRSLDAYTDHRGKTHKVVDIRHDIAEWAWDFSLDYVLGINVGKNVEDYDLSTINGISEVTGVVEKSLESSKKSLKNEIRNVKTS